LNVFSKMFPMACHFSPICSAQSCTLFTYIYICMYIYRWAKGGGGTQYFYLENRDFYLGEPP
jgi:hypothetical protein